MTKKEEKRKKATVLLGDEIEEYLQRLNQGSKKGSKKLGPGQSSMNLLVCWQKVVPQRFLDHTDNVVYSLRSKKTELLVYVDSNSCAAELSMDKELLRQRMQEELGKEISDIKFLISRKNPRKKSAEQ